MPAERLRKNVLKKLLTSRVQKSLIVLLKHSLQPDLLKSGVEEVHFGFAKIPLHVLRVMYADKLFLV